MKKLKFLFAALAIVAGGSTAGAQTDVTAQYLTNANFSEGTPVDNNVCTYGKDMQGNGTTYYGAQPIEGWTNESVGETDEKDYENSKLAGALFSYGSTPWLAGSGTTLLLLTQMEMPVMRLVFVLYGAQAFNTLKL